MSALSFPYRPMPIAITVLVTGDIPVGVDFSEVDYHALPGDSSYIAGGVPGVEGELAGQGTVEDPLYWFKTSPKPTGWMKYTFYDDAACSQEKQSGKECDGKVCPNGEQRHVQFGVWYGAPGGCVLQVQSEGWDYTGMTDRSCPGKCIRVDGYEVRIFGPGQEGGPQGAQDEPLRTSLSGISTLPSMIRRPRA